MTKLFLILHVLAAVVAVGPITVAASMFPSALRRARRTSEAREAPAGPDSLDPREVLDASDARDARDARDALSGLRMLHRICRVYAVVGLAVPVFGFATASSLGVLGSGWLIVSILLTAAAAAVLALLLLPAQARELAALQEPSPASGTRAAERAGAGRAGAGRLAMLTGVFNLLWATVTVLMIIRPGSTTGGVAVSPRHLPRLHHLRIAAHAEAISLIIMLANLATVHLEPVSSLMGPAHGCSYLFVVVAVQRIEQAPAAARATAFVPGIGGLLSLRLLSRRLHPRTA